MDIIINYAKSLTFFLIALLTLGLTSCNDSAKGPKKDAAEAQEKIEDAYAEEKSKLETSLKKPNRTSIMKSLS